MGKFRIEESLNLSRLREKTKDNPDKTKIIKKMDLAAELYPTSNVSSAKVSLYALCSGQMKKITIGWVDTLCKRLRVDPNFLFGYPSEYDNEFDFLQSKEKVK